MKIRFLIFILTMLLFSTGCETNITGMVRDAETGKPIEGAVVLTEWLTTKGLPGLTNTESSKVIEVITDKVGKFMIAAASTDTPHVTVYKKGYVAWNSEYIFPDYKKRTDFKWLDGLTLNIEKFKSEYSHKTHVKFIGSGAIAGSGGTLLDDAYSWERIIARQEMK